jgi:transcriptional regulator with XRE-family HTH domain
MATVTTNRRSRNSVQQFLDAIKSAIESKGISITALAEKAELSRPYLSKVLSGHQEPSLDVADRIAKAVGLEVRTVAPRR